MDKPKKKQLATRKPARRSTPRSPGSARQALTRETLQKFRVIFSAVKRHFQDVEERCGVSGAQLWAIAAIAEGNGLKVSELAEAMTVHQSTASNLVRELERRGLVRKERGEDQRVVRLYLTPAGAAVVARAPQPAIGVLPEALERLPARALADLNGSLDLLIDTLRVKNLAAAKTPLSDAFDKE